LIVILSGRRIDAPDTHESHFPWKNIEAVSRRIHQVLETLGSGLQTNHFISSAACGADLLGLQAAKALKFQCYIILPFERSKFRCSSVIDRGEGAFPWGTIFDELCDEAHQSGTLHVLSSSLGGDRAYTAVNQEIFRAAESIAQADSAQRVAAIVVWDGEPHSKEDVTADFYSRARSSNFQVSELNTRSVD
jgi:hypothetical protein